MNKILGKIFNSDVALIIGVLCLLSGIGQMATNPSGGGNFLAGIVIVLGVLAYKSAKKRKLNIVKDTQLRIAIEIIAIILTFLAVFLQNNLQMRIIEDPVPNIIIPLWVWGAYFSIVFSKPKQGIK